MITKEDNLTTGVLDYFPNALAAVGRHSRFGNDKYPPADGSKELRWSFDVSTNHADAIASHLAQRGTVDPDGVSHSAALAWRALALLETELVAAGAKPGKAVQRGERYGDIECTYEPFPLDLGDCVCGDIECTYEPFPDRRTT